MKIKTKENSNNNSIELDLIENTENIDGKRNKLIYGNNANIKNPKKLGNLRAFIYIKDYPLIAIGPNCKNIFNINSF